MRAPTLALLLLAVSPVSPVSPASLAPVASAQTPKPSAGAPVPAAPAGASAGPAPAATAPAATVPAPAPAGHAPAGGAAPAPAPAATDPAALDAGAQVAPAPAGDEAAPAERPVTLLPPALVAPAGADDPSAAAMPEVPRVRKGYRWQIAVTDAAAIGLSIIVDRISADGAARPGGLATFTIASYFFTAPLLHGVHRQGRRALGSFALRAGLPLVFGLIGEKIDGAPECLRCEDTLRSDGKVLGITLGALAAMALDVGLIARPYWERGASRARAAWTPTLTGVRGGATAGVFGTF